MAVKSEHYYYLIQFIWSSPPLPSNLRVEASLPPSVSTLTELIQARTELTRPRARKTSALTKELAGQVQVMAIRS